jgi:hypothetical protein
MATITTKFSLGERVWKVYPTTEAIELPCRFCRGRGWLDTKGANEETRQVKWPPQPVRFYSWTKRDRAPKR